MDYEEIVKSITPIVGFKQMVQSESKRPLAIKTLIHYLGLTEKEAKAFVEEYYSRMDLGLTMNKPHSFLNVSVLSTMNKKG